jgi:WD40 repeat protein
MCDNGRICFATKRSKSAVRTQFLLERNIVGFLICILLVVLTVLPATGVQSQGRGADCAGPEYLPSRLAGGMYAEVTPGRPNNVRSEPTTSADIVFTIAAGEVVYVTSAPVCADGYVWWQVGHDGIDQIEDFGWTAEGVDGEYWLEPVLQPIELPTARQPITLENASALQQVAQVEYGLVNAVVWSPDGRYVAISSVGAIWVYDTFAPGSDPIRITPNPLDTNQTTSMTFGFDSVSLLTGGAFAPLNETPYAIIQQFNVAAGGDGPVNYLNLSDLGQAFGAAVSPDMTRFAFPTQAGSIQLYEYPGATFLYEVGEMALLGNMIFGETGTVLATSGSGGMMESDTTLQLWEVATGVNIGVADLGMPPQDVTFGYSDALIAAVGLIGESQAAYVFDTYTLAQVQTIGVGAGVSINGLSISPDGTMIAVSNTRTAETTDGSDGRVTLFDLASANVVAEIRINAPMLDVAFSRDGNVLVVNHEDPAFWGPNRVTFWMIP